MPELQLDDILFKQKEVIFGEDWPEQLPESLQSFLDYILGKRRENEKYLLRRDFDPLDLPRLMPNLQIIEEVPGEKDAQGRCRLRWRLMGTAFHPTFQEKAKGRFLDQVIEEALYLDLRQSYDQMKADGLPRYLTAQQQMTTNNLYRYERIIVPAKTDEGPMHYIGCWYWHRGATA